MGESAAATANGSSTCDVVPGAPKSDPAPSRCMGGAGRVVVPHARPAGASNKPLGAARAVLVMRAAFVSPVSSAMRSALL